MLQAIHGDPLMRVSDSMPGDVHLLRDALARLRDYKHGELLTLNLGNCGTALRFLKVHLERCYQGEPIVLTGDQRLLERNGKPTTQTTSARILHGDCIAYSPDESPYITMSRRVLESYKTNHPVISEYDWSSAAFWYEYIALQPLLYSECPRELLLEGLTADSLQGDRRIADIYAEFFGVQTTFTPAGAILSKANTQACRQATEERPQNICIDFSHIPDLYPSIALTCERLGVTLHATGTERLAYKESNRLEAVALHETRHDHRMAMALLVAGYPVDDTACIAKSYPTFVPQWQTLLTSAEERG